MSRSLSKAVASAAALFLSVSLVQAVEFSSPDPAVADAVPPASIGLTTSRTEILAGQKARLTATTDVSVSGTGQAIEILDVATDEVLESCATGASCWVDVQFFTGEPRNYLARVGDLESDVVTVSRAAWTLTLTPDTDELAAGQSTRLVATADQNVGNTNGAYALYIFNVTTGERLAVCTTGRVCTAQTGTFYRDDAYSYEFIAIVAAADDPATFDDVHEVQGSRLASVGRMGWTLDVVTDKTTVVAGDVVRITATANQRVDLTNGRYALYLMNMYDGSLLKTCAVGRSCAVNVTWRGADWAFVPVGFVAASGATNGDELDDQQASAQAPISTTPWLATLSADKEILDAGEYVTLTATANQDLGRTGGQVALYIVDWVNDTVVKVCRTGTTCIATDRFYKSTDMPYAGHAYGAIVGNYVPGAQSWRDIDTWYGNSERVEVAIRQWQLTVAQTSGSSSSPRFTVDLNQDVGLTSGQLAVNVYRLDSPEDDDGPRVASCNTGRRCFFAFIDGPAVYTFWVSDRRAVPDTYATATGIRTGDTISTITASGPNLRDEGIGGGNPAEKGCQCGQGDPVNTATGEFYDAVTDLAIPGVGPALQLARSYSTAKADVAGPFGYGWSADLDMRVEVETPGTMANPRPVQVWVVQENGSRVLFTRSGTNRYTALERVNAALSYDEDTGGWVFVRDLTQTFTFNASGELLSLRDPNGNALEFTRAVGHVQTITASGGRTITLTWVDDRIVSAVDSAGRTVSYGYDAAGDLVEVTAADGAITRYGYDASHRIVTVTNPLGGVVTNAYDADGRVVSQTDEVGGVTAFSYDTTFPQRTDVTHPDGSVVRDEYKYGVLVAQTRAYGTPLAARTEYQYDSALNRIAVIDPTGALTTSTYDRNGRRLTQTDPLGRVTAWTYDPLGNVKTMTDPAGAVTRFAYDEHGNLITTRSAVDAIERFSYNDDGTVATHTDARGKVTAFSYTPQGWVSQTTDPVGLVTSVGYDPAGFVTSMTDPGGGVTTSTVDAAGRVLSTSDPLGRTTTYAYDAAGNLVSTTDAAGAVTTASYDIASRRLSATDALGNTTSYDYTPTGKLAAVTAPGGAVTAYAYDKLGQLVTTTDPLGRITAYGYDAAGRQVSTTLPSGATSTVTYDAAAQVTSTTDAAGKSTTLSYDAAGRLISSADPLARVTTTDYTLDGRVDTVTLPDGSTQHYVYDKTGNVTSFTDADGNVTGYAYDAAGRLVSETRPGGLVTRHNYDTAGRLFITKLPDLSTLRHYYDAAGQLVRIDPSRAGAPDVTYGYDAAGRRTTMADATGTTGYVYDVLGRLTQVTDGSGDAVGYTYDARGNLTSLSYPGGDTASYAYDAAGQLTSVTDWASNTTTFTWTANGQLATRVDPNGIAYAVGHDVTGRTTGITAGTGGAPLLDVDYGYDDAGQLTSRAIAGSAAIAASDSYGYDLLGQLAARGSGGSFHATPAGALTATADGATLAYNAAQQVTSLTPAVGPATSYGYDANGARSTATTAGDTTTYHYDPFGALSSVELPGETIGYTSDAAGLRQTRTDASGTRDFTWDVNAALARLLDDGAHRYLYGPGIVPIAQSDGTDIEYLYGDLLGSTLLVADAAGAATGAYAYSEYGTVTGHTGTGSTEIGYTGNWADEGTRLLYLRARDYDPASGQFLRVDPVVAATLQPYAYALNSPLLFADPSGLCIGMDNTPQDRPCTANDFFWASFTDGETIARSAAPSLAGLADGFTGGITEDIRKLGNTDCYVDKNAWYWIEYGLGTVASVVMGGRIASSAYQGIKRAANLFGVLDDAKSGIAAVRGAKALSPSDVLRPGGNLIGKAGTSESIRELEGGLSAAQEMFEQLARGGTVVAQDAKLIRVQVPGGGFVQLRTVMSRSPGTEATIDVNIPGLDISKLKFN
jgi:RHS repeat-associated protein